MQLPLLWFVSLIHCFPELRSGGTSELHTLWISIYLAISLVGVADLNGSQSVSVAPSSNQLSHHLVRHLPVIQMACWKFRKFSIGRTGILKRASAVSGSLPVQFHLLSRSSLGGLPDGEEIHELVTVADQRKHNPGIAFLGNQPKQGQPSPFAAL